MWTENVIHRATFILNGAPSTHDPLHEHERGKHHDRGKPCHYYTTEQLRRLVYSMNMRGASPLTTIRRSSFAGSCIVVAPLAGAMSATSRSKQKNETHL